MALENTQKLLTNLYTNTQVREQFFMNPEEVCKNFGLIDAEIQQLSQLSQQEVNLFASSLKYKRLNEVRKILLLTQKSLEKEFSQLFWQYSENYWPGGMKKHWHDALQFCTYLEDLSLKKDLKNPWVIDVVRYEKTWLKTGQVNQPLMWCSFKHFMPPLVHSLKENHLKPIVLERPTIGIWIKLPFQKQWHCFFFSGLRFPSLRSQK
jgi:hypothetical protein